MEIIKERLAENHELREPALRQRQTLLDQLQKAREIKTDLRMGNGEPLLDEPDLPDSLIDLTPVPINETSATRKDSVQTGRGAWRKSTPASGKKPPISEPRPGLFSAFQARSFKTASLHLQMR